MIRLTVYIFLALLIALGAAWISSNPGQVLITWQGLEIRFSAAVMVFLIALYTIMIWLLLWLLKKLNISEYLANPIRLATKRAKGEAELDKAWSAYALGDYKDAIKLGLRAKSKLGESGSVLRLLGRATQELDSADNPYLTTLNASPDSGGWVQKQQLDIFLDKTAWKDASALVEHMLINHPKNRQLLRLDFILKAQLGLWSTAATALLSAKNVKGTISTAEQKHYSAVIDYCLALEQKAAGKKTECLSLTKSALKSDPGFSPAALLAARVYIEQDDKKAADKILASIWSRAPNKEIADVLVDLYPLESSAETFRRLKTVAERAPQLVESGHLLAEAAIFAEHWPEAANTLDTLLNEELASKKTYQLLALLENKQKRDSENSEIYLKKAEEAPADNHWACASCLKITPHYLPNCPNCEKFDQISWSKN